MKKDFDVIRRLRAVERLLESHIEKASAALANGWPPDRLSRALMAGRPARHPHWQTFIDFASPVNEARAHVECEREVYERRLSDEIGAAVRSIRRAK